METKSKPYEHLDVSDRSPVVSLPREEGPPDHVVETAVASSTHSPCRSKRGSVVFRGDYRHAWGFNYKPRGFDCDASAACKATCRAEAIHAEQMALLAAGTAAHGSDMLHVKTVDGKLVPSGGPSCVQCSKLALAAGVRGIWLYHESGWRWYDAPEWHRLSLAASTAHATEQEAERDDWRREAHDREAVIARAEQHSETCAQCALGYPCDAHGKGSDWGPRDGTYVLVRVRVPIVPATATPAEAERDALARVAAAVRDTDMTVIDVEWTR